MIAKQSKSKSTLSLKPSRKTRTKLRKPKFLSLRLQLTATTPPPPPPPPMPSTTDHKQLINLFPLHPEHLVEQYKLDEENNMACIFSSCDDVDKAATTLTGILRSDDDDDEGITNNPSPSSVNYAEEEVELVRTAMRRNKAERDDDEKWVCYSEVVERKKEMKGISSSSSSTTSYYNQHNNNNDHHHRSKLVLKLDYEKIMKSWVNKGPLYIHGSSGMDAPQPQTVPDLQDDDLFFSSGTRHDEQDNVGNVGSWIVPELVHTENNDVSKVDDVLQVDESSVMIHNREASVQRYKEKRRNRLFSKTIRYEVRKLNAEKRPRIKGRFVKRN